MSTRFEELRMDQLVIHPKNVRRDVGDVSDLADSIKAQGIMQPLVVAPYLVDQDYGEVTQYVIIAGHRRRAGAELAGLDILPCVIREDMDSAPRQLEAMLVENTQRTDLTLSEEAEAYQAVLEYPDYTVKSIAKATGRSETLVRSRIALAQLPEKAKDCVDNGSLTLEQSTIFDEFKDDPAAVESLLKSAGTNDWNYTVNMLRRTRDLPINMAKSEKFIKEQSVKTIAQQQAWGGPYDRDYTNKLTDSEHAEAGHLALIDSNSGNIQWYVKPASTSTPKKVLTEEEIAEKKKLKDLEAGLEQDLAIWDEHLRKSLTDAGGGMPLTPAEKTIAFGISAALFRHSGDYRRAAELLLNKGSDSFTGSEVKDAVTKLRPLQLVMLLAELSLKPDALHRPATWDPTGFGWRYGEGVPRWIEVRREVFGYEPAVFEQETIDHFTALAEANAGHAADETDNDEEDGDEDA